jgi:hypothetical protein
VGKKESGALAFLTGGTSLAITAPADEARASMERQAKRDKAAFRRASAAEADRKKVAGIERQQRSARERQRARMGGSAFGRQSTILGGNVGNQSMSGAGKTLLGT